MAVTLHPQQDKRAVLVFLHGQGEIGKNPEEQVRVHGPWEHLALNKNALSEIGRFHVLGFHLSTGAAWDLPSLNDANNHLNNFINEPANYVDASRIYLTGVSIGGAGVCTLAHMRLSKDDPEPVATIAAFCPAGWAQEYPNQQMQQTVGTIPAFLFCNRRDGFWGGTIQLHQLLGGNCHLREIHDHELADTTRPHVCWRRVYGCPTFYLALDRPGLTPHPNQWVL